MTQREREAELFFRGQQYATAVARYQRARGAYPPDVDTLVRERFLRKKYKDPITGDDFDLVRIGQPLPGQPTAPGQQQPGQRGQQPPQQGPQQPQVTFRPVVTAGGAVGGGPIIGVVSKSTGTSLRVVNNRSKYNEFPFVATEATTQAGGGRGTATPGGRGTATPGGGRGTAQPGSGRGPQMNPLGPSGGGQRLGLPGMRRGNAP
jgi:hypothetical protein